MEGGVMELRSILYCAESTAELKINAVNILVFFMINSQMIKYCLFETGCSEH